MLKRMLQYNYQHTVFEWFIQINLDSIGQVNQRQMVLKNKKIGEILRELREKDSLLLRQVASDMGMDQALLSKMERGERHPSREQIIKFANVFKVDSKSLLIAYLSDKVTGELENDDVALEVLKEAKKKIIRKKNIETTIN